MIRRATDVVLASAGLVVAALPLAVAAAAIKVTSRGPIVYRQVRVGRHSREFCLYKLRTMTVGTSGPQVTTSADHRVTAAGRWLRRLKIDELPQFWNVLRGDMAIIGPRPEVPRFVARYTAAQRAILNAQPGLASVSALMYAHEAQLLRDQPDPEDAYVRYLMAAKIAADLDYERTRTMWSDFRLLFEMALSIVGRHSRIDRAFRIPSPIP